MACRAFTFRHRSIQLTDGQPLLTGILNCTPDSFSDGGDFTTPEAAVDRAEKMLTEGAAIIDIGGESTRPGFTPIDAAEECRRILPVVTELRRRRPDAVISVDTTKAAVAREALSCGAEIINDISGLADPEMAAVLSEYRAGCILMHHGTLPSPALPPLHDALQGLLRSAMAQSALPASNFLIDPGIGFGKTDDQLWEILSRLSSLTAIAPLCLGVSRKSFIGRATGIADPLKRLPGTLAIALLCRRGCSVLRVHDVAEHRQILSIATHFPEGC